MSDATEATSEAVGQTAADLLGPLTDCADCDVYLSRSLEIRMVPRVTVADVVWLEDAGGATCFFRLTPARFAGLVLEFRAQKARFDSLAGAVPSTPDDVAALARVTAIFEKFTAVMKLLKAECLSRWPKVMAEYAKITPEELRAPPRASDLWRDGGGEAGPPPATAAAHCDGRVAELLAWAGTSPDVPAAPFCPVPFAVVLDSAAWFSRLVAHARESCSPKALARLDRVRRGLTDPAPGPAAARAAARAASRAA